jgi:hypothetical protein
MFTEIKKVYTYYVMIVIEMKKVYILCIDFFQPEAMWALVLPTWT